RGRPLPTIVHEHEQRHRGGGEDAAAEEDRSPPLLPPPPPRRPARELDLLVIEALGDAVPQSRRWIERTGERRRVGRLLQRVRLAPARGALAHVPPRRAGPRVVERAVDELAEERLDLAAGARPGLAHVSSLICNSSRILPRALWSCDLD